MNINKALLYGNLTRDPEIKAASNGTSVCSFSLATNRSFTKDGQKQEQTEYHNVISFGKTAEVMQKYLKRGSSVYVEGRLQTRSWDDKESGKKQYRTEVIVDNFQFGPKSEGKQEAVVAASVHPLEGEFQPRDKTMQEGKTYKPANYPDGQEYPDSDINPEDIPF